MDPKEKKIRKRKPKLPTKEELKLFEKISFGLKQ
jgi:hypothetical protein